MPVLAPAHPLRRLIIRPRNHNVTTMRGAFFPETMSFCLIVFGRHSELRDIARRYCKYSALASWDVAGRGVELDWAITNVPVGRGGILTVWGAQQGHGLKGEEGGSVLTHCSEEALSIMIFSPESGVFPT